ncbi:hypothetical protein EVAR_101994_1 [Eumeta japonica]|uniref:Uncharacterized protein n=1 Tax=Eumeta variegata TaxID=151549 RepID=A0A4C1TSJ3_EUMVA|nr:hypothetical protein EVAR_101994_1 [Eumeta japonica]
MHASGVERNIAADLPFEKFPTAKELRRIHHTSYDFTLLKTVQQLASRWHWLYRRYCACVIPLFAPQSGDSCLLRVSEFPADSVIVERWTDAIRSSRQESC